MTLRPLYDACRAALAALPEAAPFLAGLPEDPGPETPRPAAETPGTRELARVPPGPPLLERIRAAAPALEWRQSYRPGEGMDDYLKGSGYVELTGQRGAFPAPATAFGIAVIGPGCHYPEHRHGPAEIYLVLAGHAEWHYPPAPWRRHGPGAAVLTPPGAWHAIRTGEACLVMLYAWTGGDPVTVSEIRT